LPTACALRLAALLMTRSTACCACHARHAAPSSAFANVTPLHIAAMRGKMRVAAALVRAAMQEDACNGGGGGERLAALWAARSKSGHTAEDVARRLADGGVDLRRELELLLGADALPPQQQQQEEQGAATSASGEHRSAHEEEPSAKRLRSAP
jgi:hypothetical protein